MSTQTSTQVAPSAAPIAASAVGGRASQLWGALLRPARAIAAQFSSSLIRRIVFLNMSGLFFLVIGFLFLIQFRADIIDARVQSLRTQASIIAAAVAASSADESDTITVNPEDLLHAAPAPALPFANDDSAIEFSINPERVGPMLHRLVTPTHTRALVYDRDAFLLLDSRSLQLRNPAMRPVGADEAESGAGWTAAIWRFIRHPLTSHSRAPTDDAAASDGQALPEIIDALNGKSRSIIRVNASGDTVVSVSMPIQRLQTISGALLLSTHGGEIDAVIASERWALLLFFLVLAIVMFILSLALANTIAEPVRRLAAAAERVGRGDRSRQQIPDFTYRHDEIGHLSHTLRKMTQALYTRMDAIESFAADVAHELKNPLTSLRSAVEVLPKVKPGPSHNRLLEVIQHDVRRLDRLISDISDASRLDAELARGDASSVDLEPLMRAVIGLFADSPRSKSCKIILTPTDVRSAPMLVLGHDSRLAQVFTNLIDNACSFSAPGGQVRLTMSRVRAASKASLKNSGELILISVDDDGPGIPAHALERIFERFYTDRPSDGFGQNSGLGLSISRQIIEAHGGRITAENRIAGVASSEQGNILGARFTVALPALPE